MNLKQIDNPELFRQVIEAGKQDGHDLLAPNLVVLKEQEIVGAVTILPVHLVWMDTKKNKVRDSIQLEQTLETMVNCTGGRLLCMPCSEQSPYYSLLPKAGFSNVGKFSLFIKKV